MELRYNLTRQEFKRGLLLHERRLKGALSVIRRVEWFFFLATAVFGAVRLFMLLVVLASGRWEEEFGSVFWLAVCTLGLSLAFLWLTSARRRAFHGERLMTGEAGFFGPWTLNLTRDGVAVTYGVSRRMEPYDAIDQVWEKKGFVLLYLKVGLWVVLPPYAFQKPEERTAFLTALEEARQGCPPQEDAGEYPMEAAEGEEIAFSLRYTWTPEGLHQVLLRANLAYLRTRLYWRPAMIVVAVLSLPALAVGILMLIGALSDWPAAGADGVLYALGALTVGACLCLPWLSFVPGFVDWAIRRQEKKDMFRKLLEGPITDIIGPHGVDSLRPGERERTLWSQIGGVKSADWGLVLFRLDRKMLLFPPEAFSNRGEQEQVAEYARGQL